MLKYRYIGHRASGIGHRASGIGHRASGILLTQKCFYIHSIKSVSIFLQKFVKQHLSLNTLLSYSFQQFSNLKLFFIFLYLAMVPCTYGLSSFTVNIIQGNSPKVDNVKLATDKHGLIDFLLLHLSQRQIVRMLLIHDIVQVQYEYHQIIFSLS